ncbi:DUF1003 domain-containing protein [Phenylobacterium sp.]|uniref:DUF1003 domain-containing protein n=1 Tax=Phenylobacterium sp. TaxID=1871053 RepID=UPI002DF1D62F|nr:DUF1003 domain-containing protein [Phenylobacterium sp.]
MADTAPTTPAPKPLSLDEFRKRRKVLPNRHEEVKEKLKPLQRLALWITRHVGTMGFFLVIFTWTVIWLAWNFLAPKSARFDPPMGFVFYLFISNVIQILLMPLIMVGQNIQGAEADARAQHDLDVNVKAEEEIEVILSHLEYQNHLLLQVMNRLQVQTGQVLDNVTARTRAQTARPKTTRKSAPKTAPKSPRKR